MRTRFFSTVLAMAPGVIGAAVTTHEPRPTLFAEVTASDISDDAITYRLVGDIPAAPDPLGRLLRSAGQSWTAAVGFAEVRDAIDTGTGRLTAKGGDAYFINLGRQWEWRLPEAIAIQGWKPRLQGEAGLHYASASVPAGGTHFQFLLSGGFEWRRVSTEPGGEWAVGIRWLHYSNANLFTSNAGYDAIVFRLGRTWQW
jgi:hypothetical protein